VETKQNTQNITLALPKNLLRKVKLAAVQRNTSVSALLTRALEQLVNEDSGYNQARQRQMNLLEHGVDLGIQQNPLPTREELHER
jgi:hypothetical protein